MKKLLLLILTCLSSLGYSQQTLQERLGYAKDAKLLIIHADDLGLAYSENKASVKAMENGSVSSASIMVPCPWFPEIAAYAAANPQKDFGIHLTLTSEWKYFKFSPVASREKVPELVNKRGFFFESVDSVVRSATSKQVEIELRAQIDRALQFGIDITHLDSHMGTLFARKDYLETLINLGREYKIPVMLSKQMSQIIPQNTLTSKDVMLDMIYIASPADYKKGMAQYYAGVIKGLTPGVSVLLLHAAYDDHEMQGITIDHPDYGAAWRQADFDFFSSEECKSLLKANNIKLITWKEIRDELVR